MTFGILKQAIFYHPPLEWIHCSPESPDGPAGPPDRGFLSFLICTAQGLGGTPSVEVGPPRGLGVASGCPSL